MACLAELLGMRQVLAEGRTGLVVWWKADGFGGRQKYPQQLAVL